ncbi:WD40-repeat-containing domain protein [Limtongia smithiae]|uniref:WD40-repeat-containing domain protein n=1 Tax=Limtongia smithiae TaxID=1125753 RepID=UPI0034CF9B87
MERRKAEIEAKKAKLADLKRQREQRQQQHGAIPRDVMSTPPRVPSFDRRSDIDQLVASLVGSPRGTSTSSTGSAAAALGKTEQHDSRSTSADVSFDSSDLSFSLSEKKTSSAELTIATATIFEVLSTTDTMTTTAITATPKIAYSKEVQTDESWLRDHVNDPCRDDLSDASAAASDSKLRDAVTVTISSTPSQITAAADQRTSPLPPPQLLRHLDPETTAGVFRSSDFLRFIDTSSKIVERALDDDYDILIDYSSVSETKVAKADWKLKQSRQFYSQTWSASRAITSIDWSSEFSELVLTSYAKNPSSSRESLGIVQVWNMHLSDRAEYIFHAQSDILTAKFSPFHPNLIVGGCYNGQILVWDTRSKAPDPVQRSPQNGAGHTHPIYSLTFLGTQNAHGLLSSSTDGRVCYSTLDMLARPSEINDLKLPPPSRTEDLAPTVLGVSSSADTSFFLAGSEDGNIYTYNRSARMGAQAGLNINSTYRGHFAPVTGLSFHPANGLFDLSDLVLSCSLDWTIKLWQVAQPATATTSASSQASSGALLSSSATSSAAPSATSTGIAPLIDIPVEDAVYDVAWSPIKSGVFASAGCAGTLDVWDLALEQEVPMASERPTPYLDPTKAARSSPQGATITAPTGPPRVALNKVAWSHDGKRIATGGLSSVVNVFDVGSELALPRADEWKDMRNLIMKYKTAQ